MTFQDHVDAILDDHTEPAGIRLLRIAALRNGYTDGLPRGRALEDLAKRAGLGRGTAYRARALHR